MAKLTIPAFKLKWQQRFRDNDNFEIGEKDLREFSVDAADTFGQADTTWNYRGLLVLPTAPDALTVAKGDVFRHELGLWQVLEAGSVSSAPAAGTQWRQLLAFEPLGYQDGGVFTPNTDQVVKKDWVYSYGVQRWRSLKDMTANAAPSGGNWQKVFDATPLPASITLNMLAAETVKQLLPATNGVLAWLNGTPLGVYASLAAAADAVGPGTRGTTLFQVYGKVGTASVVQYVKQSATVQLMAGAVLTASLFACHYSNESESSKRTIRLVGEGELVADIQNYAFSAGLRLEVECAKWTGALSHNTNTNSPRAEYWFRGVRINSRQAALFDVRYQYGGNYATCAFIWLDGCIMNAQADVFVARGTGTDGGGANAGDTNTQNLFRITKSTIYASGRLLNTDQGGAALEQDAAGGGTQVDWSNYYTKSQAEAKFALKGEQGGVTVGASFRAVGNSQNSNPDAVRFIDVPKGTFYKLNIFDVVRRYRGEGYDAFNSRYTVPETGTYEVKAQIEFTPTSGSSSAVFYLMVYVNGVRNCDIGITGCPAPGEYYGLSGPAEVDATAGDYIELYTWHSAEGGKLVLAAHRASFSVRRIYV